MVRPICRLEQRRSLQCRKRRDVALVFETAGGTGAALVGHVLYSGGLNGLFKKEWRRCVRCLASKGGATTGTVRDGRKVSLGDTQQFFMTELQAPEVLSISLERVVSRRFSPKERRVLPFDEHVDFNRLAI